MEERIIKKLQENINIEFLNVINESHLHAGHREGGGTETHFQIEIKSEEFEGKTRIESHKVINNLLKEEFKKNGLHALSIKILKI